MPLFAKISSLTIGDSLLISLLGMAIVFLVLIVLAFVIRLISFVVQKMEKKASAISEKAVSSAPAAAPAAESKAGMVPAPGSLGEIKLHSVDDKTAAIIMAIVADQMEVPLNELRFLSIKEIEK